MLFNHVELNHEIRVCVCSPSFYREDQGIGFRSQAAERPEFEMRMHLISDLLHVLVYCASQNVQIARLRFFNCWMKPCDATYECSCGQPGGRHHFSPKHGREQGFASTTAQQARNCNIPFQTTILHLRSQSFALRCATPAACRRNSNIRLCHRAMCR